MKKLLIITQVVDSKDLYLGFFHGWIEELAKRFESIEVICLKEGTHSLPGNVRVHSLGKEKGAQPAYIYALRFLKLAWKLEKEYDAVFVHMNQEYLLLAGWMWKTVLGKRVYLWRNHYAGSWLTDIAVSVCDKVFCTSTHSYTARYKKTVIMPVGVDTERFHPDAGRTRTSRSILFFGRFAPSKRPGLLVDALILLAKRGVLFTASFVGSPLPKDETYLASLKQRIADAGLAGQVKFLPGVPNTEAIDLYRAYEISVNMAGSGMFDKTVFEACASGCLSLATSDDYAKLVGPELSFESTAEGLSERLEALLALSVHEREQLVAKGVQVAKEHNLQALMDRLAIELQTAS